MKQQGLRHKIFRTIYHYFLFFLLAAFLVTCSTMLFVSVLSASLELELTEENLNMAAKLTFGNVIFLSILFTVFDAVRRKLTTGRITKHIAEAANRVVQGDFSVRIAPVNQLGADEKFNEIIDCFNTMAEELAGVETLRTDFIANVSHEMKTPLAVMRFLLIRYVNRNQIGKSRSGELKRSRLCAYILMTVNLVLSGVVLMMVYFQRGFQYQGFLIYVMALYTFYITTVAIVELVKYRKYQSPVMSVSKIIKLASALFSMLFLETAMFSQFGSGASEMFKRNMIMATGAGISVTVTVMAVYVIVRTTKEIKQLKREKQRSL